MFLEDKRFLYVILGILIISNLARMTTEGLLAILLTLPAVLIAITFHEYAHAFAATKLGDDTPMLQGRLTLNPMKHVDPVGFALLLFAGFGWGKPVQINPRNFNRKYSIEAGEAIVSVAGPIMNFVLAVVFALIYAALYRFAPTFIITQVGAIVFDMLLYLVMINIGLGVFNLIPLPPLDGSKILIKFLPYNAKQWFRNKETIFYIIFLVLWISGLTGYIISPALNFLYRGMLNGALALFGLF